MTRRKRKLTPAEKAQKMLMHEKYEWVFLNGKQKRIRRAPTDEFIRRNADPIWLLENEMYEELHKQQQRGDIPDENALEPKPAGKTAEDLIPF